MKKLFVLLASSAGIYAQNIADVQVLFETAKKPPPGPTVVLTLTATLGDNSNCIIAKVAGATINAQLSCSVGTNQTNLMNAKSTGIVAQTFPWGIGDVFCVIGMNPTVNVVTLGTLINIPPNSLAWSCSTNIRTGGNITGQTAIVNGSTQWP